MKGAMGPTRNIEKGCYEVPRQLASVLPKTVNVGAAFPVF